ncbi:M13 family peptidase [Luteolibacter pohnpeiensis]|uniref:M13 family peptidase n=1 Tax=Luteolibacter pohnpeiensis TaxID=454153 RepID=A0A934S4W3_9BACT|nr:M13-type metalloendopeptidase [Luteolibacter pohnpeiensis]MBK1881938.1 M13 family peptidase [Luteolibacter pohnpeiensis]
MNPLLAPVSLLGALALYAIANDPKSTDDLTTSPRFGEWGFDMSGKDESVKPGDDFFAYANGTYLKRTEIPSDRSRFGNFDALAILSEARVHEILEDAAKNPTDATRKIGMFYQSYMDEDTVEKLGTAPIQPELEKIKSASSRDDLITLMADPGFLGSGLFGVGINADAKDATKYAIYMGSGGLGLPDKDYYLKESFAEIREKYKAYLTTLMTLIGWPEPAATAKQIIAYETQLAEASWDRADLRDRDKTYHLMTPAQLVDYAPGFDFVRLFKASGLPESREVIVRDNTAFPLKAKVFAETPLEVLKAWTACGLADGAAPFLSKAFVDASFDFNSKTLSGQPEQMARWKRAVSMTNGVLGEEVGKVYVAKYFPEESKRQMLELVNNVKAALSTRLDRLDWMGDETRKAAHEKLAKFTVKIGYPDQWRDYSALEIKADDLYGNIVRNSIFSWHHDVERLDKPVDRSEWGMPPQMVNAYYNPSMNEIVFPAAILQPPFFDPKADPAINYGGIGGVIGHEISHGFDDQGRKSNGDGVLQDWWTDEDKKQFNERAERLGKQYEGIEVMPGEHIDGQLTMGENIGDMGGVNLALEAYQAYLNGKPAPVIDGTTGVQRVFLSWAQLWRQKVRDEALVRQIHTDPHAPAVARVNGVVRNIDAWYKAFDVKPGDKLYVKPEDRVKIW